MLYSSTMTSSWDQPRQANSSSQVKLAAVTRSFSPGNPTWQATGTTGEATLLLQDVEPLLVWTSDSSYEVLLCEPIQRLHQCPLLGMMRRIYGLKCSQ